MMSWFKLTPHTGLPIPIPGGVLIPRTQVIEIQLPRWRFTWNRPTSLTFQPQDGPAQMIPVVDYTRLIQVLLLISGLWIVSVFGRRAGD